MKNDQIGIIVIGRNEGERLRRSLQSISHPGIRVYVDSGSTDGSPALAKEFGFDVVQLSSPPAFTAARARNAGFQRIQEIHPDVQLVQMVDGDCELAHEWLKAASSEFDNDPMLAVVFGRTREMRPDASVYNFLCDDEWQVPVGEARSSGGNAMFRVSALAASGGYRSEIIAGEDTDLCLRLRQSNWKIRHIAAEMTVHDAAIFRFSVWWRRTKRGGHAFAELAIRHGHGADPALKRELVSIVAWCCIGFGGVAALFSWLATGHAVFLAAAGAALFAYLVQAARLTYRRVRAGMTLSKAWSWAYHILLGKFAQLIGVISFFWDQFRSRTSTLHEYKT